MRTLAKAYRSTSAICFGLLLAVLTGNGCAASIMGQVLDAQTRQPIEGAVVLGVWTTTGGVPGLYHTELVGVKETVTDKQGRFTLDRPQSFGMNEEAITIYKFGYVAWSNLFIFPTSARREDNRVPPEILLERFPPGQSHERHMSFIDGATRAGMYGRERIPNFRNALRPEVNLR